MSTPIRVVLVDDHPVVRQGLAAIVNLEDDIEVVGEAENGQEAIDLVRRLQPEVVLMDLQMPVLDGVEATKRIHARFPAVHVIILTTFGDDEYIYEGIAAGARGYLLKDAPPDQLVEAIRVAHRGESLLTPEVAARILDRFSSMMIQRDVKTPSSLPVAAGGASRLTAREREVLALMGQGARNKDIAAALVITERTVKIHASNIFSKLNVNNRTEAVTVALKLGLISYLSD